MILVGLPAYNEAEALGPLVGRILAVFDQAGLAGRILIYNDGSVDDTLARAQALAQENPGRVVVLDGGVNQGLGAALAALFSAFLAEPDQGGVLVVMDADLTHDPALVPDMLAQIGRGAELVVASRYAAGAGVVGVSPFRRLMSDGAGLTMRLLFPFPGLRDYTCGYRAYTRPLLARLHDKYGARTVSETSFACMTEVLLKLRRLKPRPRAAEVPLVLRYDRKPGGSKMNVARTIRRTLRVWLRFGWGLGRG